MSRSIPIVLTATAISFGNELAQDGTPNFRIVVAGLGVSVLFDGIEKVSQSAAVGLGVIMLIAVLVTPIGAKNQAPFETVNKWLKG